MDHKKDNYNYLAFAYAVKLGYEDSLVYVYIYVSMKALTKHAINAR